MPRPYVRHRWTGLAILVVAGLLGVAYGLAPTPTVQYGVWLSIFAIWMWWFVVVARRWIADADF